MESFEGKIAVVTGGGTGMGSELVVQLAAQGCSVAACDVIADTLAATVKRAENEAKPGVHVTSHQCDVADATQVDRFRDEVLAQHDTDHINLLFNNAGIGGGGSFLTGKREEWDRVFGIDWGGVYNCARAFVPLLVASDDGYLINTSSVNGFWASLGPGNPHTAYSAAKFAVKGFSEALIEDFRVNAPHVKVAVVMPGHIGTDIVDNSRRVLGGPELDDMTTDDIAEARVQIGKRGMPVDGMSDDDIREMMKMFQEAFKSMAPVSAAQAATIILDAVKAGKWRILIGDDAHRLDEVVRANPEGIYDEGGVNLISVMQQGS
ncbi:MAG TPA: SDR family NAD(P)-dependent oxidoreductase [Acidimicrobiales bacterium]|nr:SDR family NAD(P)-dependent oxidoreductase [Acidimicrobiales bacterium]